MTISGSYTLGPNDGSITLHTERAGMAAKLGHDLTIAVGRWEAKVDADPDNLASSQVSATLDINSLKVVEGHGGMKALSDKDKDEIVKNAVKSLQGDSQPQITFRSDSVSGTESSGVVHGLLSIAGNERPASLDLVASPDGTGTKVTGTMTVVQTEWGIKLYSKMGGLKVADAVTVKVDITVPTTG